MSDTTERLGAALTGRYAVERELGAGGMATVYLARDLRHDRAVAIKVLHPELGAALGSERFLSEIKTTARLQHPHILPLLDSGDAGPGLLYYVMPYVPGETLRARLSRERQLPIPDAVRLARQVADALGHAHAQGIIHRDIKPENILLQGGHALVADFGIALAVQQAGGSRLTQTGLSLGTPQYMSPEQAMGERAIDARSDLYALGAVTYEMLAGEPPFSGPSVQAIVAKVLTERPVALRSVRDTIGPAIESAVLGALAKLPADRPSTAAEFAAALDLAGTGASTQTAPAARAPRRAVGVATTATGVALAAIALWGWMRPAPAPEVIRYAIDLSASKGLRDWTGRVALSPDGSTIVHVGGSTAPLLVRRRNELGFTPLPGTEGAAGPTFSPDGKQVAYFAAGRLMTATLSGAPPVVLDDSLPVPEALYWSSDGFIYRNIKSDDRWGLSRMEVRPGATLERLTTLDTAKGEVSHYFPELVEEAGVMLFEAEYLDGRRMIAMLDLATRERTDLFPGVRARSAGGDRVVYTTGDGKLWTARLDFRARKLADTPQLIGDNIPMTIIGPVDFAVSVSGTLVHNWEAPFTDRELYWVSRTGEAHPVDTTWRGAFSTAAISPDGRRIAASLRTPTGADVWIRAGSGGTPIRLSEGTPHNGGPSFSGDGGLVFWTGGTAENAAGDVFMRPADGSGSVTKVADLSRSLSEHAWSSHGFVVRTSTGTPGAGDILLVPRGDTARALVATARSEYSPSVSPDGRWMAYTSNASGQQEVYVTSLPAAGTSRWQVSRHGGSSPRWSRRGDEIFYLDTRGRMTSASVTTTPAFALGATRVLFDAGDYQVNSASRHAFDVAPDGRFLFIRHTGTGGGARLIVIEHWLDEIARKAP